MQASVFGSVQQRTADAVVIGGGIVGAAAALGLAERGCQVVLCEKGEIGAEQSSRALGWVRVSGREPRDIPLSLETRRLWARLNGAAGYRQCGLLFACTRESEIATHEAWLQRARDYGVDAQLISARQAATLAPHLAPPLSGALYAPRDGRVEPRLAARAVATAASAKGALIAERTAVRGIETQAGRIAGVLTERGRIACSAVLIAAGIGTARLCRTLGLALPMQVVESFVMSTEPLAGPEISVYVGGFGLRRTLDGRYVLGMQHRIVPITLESLRWFWHFLPALAQNWKLTRLRLGFGSLPRDPWQEQVWARARELFPLFRAAAIAEAWGGAIDVTPDALPVIAAAARVPGLYIAAGFSGGGLGTGLGGGYLAADLVLRAAPRVDPAPYRLERFGRAPPSN